MATPTRRAPRLSAELRREQLLDAALEVLTAGGWRGMTIEAVAGRAAVSRPVVYAAFGDLQGLILALLDRAEQTALGPLLQIVDVSPGQDVDPERFLRESVLRFLRAVRGDPRTWRLVLTPPGGSSSELRERIRRSRLLVAEHVERLLNWGVRCRGGPSGLDHALAARLIVAAGEDAARLMLAHPRRFTPERFAELTGELVALLPPDGAPSGLPPRLRRDDPATGARAPGGTAAGAGGRRMPRTERREQLLDAALELLAERGFDALNMEAIARRAGVNRVVVYRSFANLHILLAALLRREDRRIMGTLERVIPPAAGGEPTGPPARLLGQALADFLDAVLAAPERWRVALLRPESAPVALQQVVNRRRATLARRLEPLLAWSLAQTPAGGAQLDTEALARLLLSVCEEQARLALEDPQFGAERLLAGSFALLELLPGG
jgi:AcrR family transcriptional regulator